MRTAPTFSREKGWRLLPPLVLIVAFAGTGFLVPTLRPVIDLALPFFGLIGLGYACGILFDAPPEGLAWLNIFITWLALPAMLFTLISATPVGELANGRFVLCSAAATGTAFLLPFLYGRLVQRASIPEATMQGMAGGYANNGYMGPGLAFAFLGAAAATPTALIFVSDTVVLFTILPVAMALAQGGGQGALATGRLIAWRIVSHPFVLATIAGVLAAAFSFHPAPATARVLTLLAGAAAPCALFALGVSVGSRPLRRAASELPVILAVKLIGHPAIVLLYLSLVGSLPPVWVATAVLLASLPPALNVFVMANQYGVYVERASSAILLGTVLSVVTVTTVLWLLSASGFGTVH